VTTLVKGEEVVRLGEPGEYALPHLLVRHERVDADEPGSSYVERDEEPRDHVVRSDDGRSLEHLLVIREVLLELVQLGLGYDDGVGRRVGEAESGCLDRTERCGGGREGEGSVEVSDDGELYGSQSCCLSDVHVV
jgi:hypothetical protein